MKRLLCTNFVIWVVYGGGAEHGEWHNFMCISGTHALQFIITIITLKTIIHSSFHR